jgi:predicted dienelactone hydrolase
VIYLVFGLAILGSTLAIILSIAFPVFQFPLPTGPYEIGTLVYDWVDESRPEIFTGNPNVHRELMVQIWYPAQKGS